MWETVQSYAGQRPIVTLSSGTAFADLDFRASKRFELELKVGPFHSEWHSVRLPFMGDMNQITSDPRFMPAMTQAIEFLKEQQARLGPRAPNEVIDLDWKLDPLPEV